MARQVIILFLTVLVAVVAGCGGAHRYDGRLVQADSLMQANPDSALALVEAVNADSLVDEGDRAYRDLLLTQARYKCYVTATSDSDINRALNYYRQHDDEREKLTRAYIYKGAVMQELNHPDSAMYYYKTAEATADTSDYFNRGYANLQMATLYRDLLFQDTAEFIHLKQAIYCFENINDTNYLISCYGHLGGAFGIKQPDSTEYYLVRAIELAVSRKSTKQYTYKSTLAGLYYYHYQDYSRAKDLAMGVMRDGKEYCKENQFYYYAALSYIKLGMLDSAKYVLSHTPSPKDAVDSMNRHQVIADIAKAEKDLVAYSKNLARSKDNQILTIKSKNNRQLKTAESDFSIHQAEKLEIATKHRNRYLTVILIIVISIMTMLVCFIIHMRQVIKKNAVDKRQIEMELISTIDELQEKQSQLQQMNQSVSKLVACRLNAINELLENIKFKRADTPEKAISIISLPRFISEVRDSYHPLKVELSDQFWKNIKQSVDGEFNGIVSYVESHYPNLSDKEMKMFCLLCAKISPQLIKLCLNQSSAKSISNYRGIIIKKKMGLDMTLEEFIQKYMNNEFENNTFSPKNTNVD